MTIKEIYQGAQRLIDQIIRKESSAQGHFLTGALEDSLDSSVAKEGKADVMQGLALYYAQFVNEGVPASSVSWKQFPFLVEYFKKRGVTGDDDRDAKAAAAATIRVWMRDGMPTQASKRFSSTGSRVQMIENSIAGNGSKIDGYMGDAFDFHVEEEFQNEKNETV